MNIIPQEKLEQSSVAPTNAELRERPSDPNRVVRITPLEYVMRETESVSGIEARNKIELLFSEIKNFGISVSVKFSIGEHKNIPTLYSTTPKVEGNTLDLVGANEQIAINKTLELYGSLIDYYIQKYSTDELFLWDITRPEQYIYGKEYDAEKTSKTIYLVDTGIALSKEKSYLFMAIQNIVETLNTLNLSSQPIQELKERIFNFLEDINEQDKIAYRKQIDNITTLLSIN